jgi:ubiquinone/menaquinone biosynthesis C-methylase UbiE
MSEPQIRDWDATTYDRVSDIQLGWALEQLARLELRGDEILLDAGCGSGRVTALLVDMAPRGHVYGADVAPSMAAHAAQALGERATILCRDLLALELPGESRRGAIPLRRFAGANLPGCQQDLGSTDARPSPLHRLR